MVVAVVGGLPAVADALGGEAQNSTPAIGALSSEPLRPPKVNEPQVDLTAPGSAVRDRGARHFDKARSSIIDTTEATRTYQNPDGTVTVEQAAGQKWFKDAAGAWKDVDLDLASREDGRLSPTGSPTPVLLATRGDQQLAEMPLDRGRSLSISVDGMDQNATGSRKTAASLNGSFFNRGGPSGLSVLVQPLVHGFESTYTADSADQLTQPIRERIRLPLGWSARQIANGVEFLDENGKVAAAYGNGVAFDGAAVPSRVPVVTALERVTPGVAVIIETVDPAWLADPARVYPIAIDPTMTRSTAEPWGGDWWVVSSDTTNTSGDTASQLFVGNWGIDSASNWVNYRTEIVFPQMNFPTNAGVVDAELTLHHVTEAGTCTTKSLVVQRNTAAATAKNWNGQSPTSGPDQVAFSDSCAHTDRTVDITEMVDGWVRNHFGNFGVRIAPLTEWELNAGRGFSSADAGNPSTLYIDYDNLPGKATPAGPADKAVMLTTTPTLSVNAAAPDADGDTTYYFYRLSTAPDAESGERADSGWLPWQLSWTVPTGYLRDGATYYWHVFTWDAQDPGVIQDPSAIQSFRIDSRLGDGGPSPTDTFGPTTVNLATGNMALKTSTPSFSTVGGAISFNATYNSSVAKETGLTGEYFSDGNHDSNFNDPLSFRRVDSSINFAWGTGAPATSVPADYYLVRWTGFFTAPTAGTYSLGAVHDDGVRLYWGDISYPALDEWGTVTPTNVIHWGSSITLNAGQTVPIKIDYQEITGNSYVGLYLSGPGYSSALLPSSLLSPNPQSMPTGWNFSTDLDGDLAYTGARVSSNSVVVSAPDGSTTSFAAQPGGGWIGPADQDETLTQASDGTLDLFSQDGRQYRFSAAGNLISVQSTLDIRNPAAPVYTYAAVYNAGQNRLAEVKDPVSNRIISLNYGSGSDGVCDARTGAPSGAVNTPPVGMLCRISYWDGTRTDYWYNSNGQLAQIDDPGLSGAPETTGFAYDANGRMMEIRDPRAVDFVRAGKRADDSSVRTRIAYDGNGRVTSVRLPDPETGMTGTPVRHAYTYPSASQSTVDVDGFSPPSGHARVVTYDGGGRSLTDTDATGLTTTKTWRSSLQDLPVTVTGPEGMRTSTLYDHAERPTDTWGPANSAWFNADGTPQSGYASQIPHATTAYDEGMQSLSVSYWDNANLAGNPRAIELGVGRADGQVIRDYAASPPPSPVPATNFSVRSTGEIRLRESGIYTFRLYVDDGVRLFIDDTLVVNHWVASAPAYQVGDFVNAGDSWHRIRMEYFNLTGSAVMQLEYTPPSGANLVVPGYDLAPRYGLATSSIDADGKKTATEYAQPQFSLASATSQDPNGLNIRSQTSYEPVGTNYFRVMNTTMPKGGVTTNTYYGNTSTAVDPCGTLGSINQGGALRYKEDPDPDGAGSQTAIKREYVYDAAGRVIASRVVGDANWSCTIYDGRGRATSQTDSAGKTSTFDYSDPTKVVTAYSDWGNTARFTTAESNLAGQAVKYTDEHGTVTRTTYDQLGRQTATYRSLFGAAEAQLTSMAYATNGRLQSSSEYASGGARTTNYSYDSAGRPQTTTLPNNLTTTTGYDANLGTVTLLNHASGSTALSNWSYARSLAGRITSETGAGRVRGFTYDNAGRLTQTTEGAFTRRYAFDANTNRCANAANCSSPTFTYDNADRILTSPYATSYSYDAHGNTTAVNYSGPQPSGAVNDTAGFDTSTTSSPRTVPLVVGRSGAINAALDWNPTQPANRTGTASPSIVGGNNTSAAMTVQGMSELGATVTWPQALGYEPWSANPTVTAASGYNGPAFTPNTNGTLTASASWGQVDRLYTVAGPTITQNNVPWTQNVTVSANGTFDIKLSWPFKTLNNPNLDLELWDGATRVANSATSFYGYNWEDIGYNVTGLAVGQSRVYTVKVIKVGGQSTAFTIANGALGNPSKYPVTPTVGFELRNNATNTLVAGSTPVAGQNARTISATVTGGVAYKLVATTTDDVAVAMSQSTPNAKFPTLLVELKDPSNATVGSGVTSSTGSLTMPAQLVTNGGNYSWKITNQSGSSYTATPTLNWSATTRGTDTFVGPLATLASSEQSVVPDANGTLSEAVSWSTDPGGTTPNVTLALKDAAGTVLTSTSNATGSASLAWPVVGGTTYKVAVTNNSSTVAIRKFTRTATMPSQGYERLELLDADGVVKHVGTGRKPQAIAQNVAPGSYTLRITPVSGVGSGTGTATFPGRVPGETTTFDGRDHAITIDDGTTKVQEYLSPTGRVIRRVVGPSAGGPATEDTLIGYDDDGDSPAYSRATTGGPVTTYLDGAIDVGGTVTFQHANLHGDIIGTSTSSGVFTPITPADEYGLQDAASTSRLGWLGKQLRFEVGVNNLTRMGVRLYDPRTGRFTSVDPIEGGSANDYDYVNADPVNDFDLAGTWGWSNIKKWKKKHVTLSNFGTVMSVASVFGCVTCGAIATGISIYQTSRACKAGQAVSCGIGYASAILGGTSTFLGAGGKFAKFGGGRLAGGGKFARLMGRGLSAAGRSLGNGSVRVGAAGLGLDGTRRLYHHVTGA